MKKAHVICCILILALLQSSCSFVKNAPYEKYSYEFIGAFDTVIQFTGYFESQNNFDKITEIGQSRFMELHKLFDIYNDYNGINNIKTINDNAGIKPVEVSQEIIDLILFSKDWYIKTNGKCNIALGPVLKIWHDYRQQGIDHPEGAQLPPLEKLQADMQYTDIDKVIVDTAKKTVYLENGKMRLDVGAIAKGYASEIIADELKKAGCSSLIISSGGNVKAIGQPLDGTRTKWGIGIQNPEIDSPNFNEEPIDVLFINNQSVVTSGDYQRFYTVAGKQYHHLIDPETLQPADHYLSVTVIAEDSGVADFLSTTLFLTPYEEGRQMAESLGVNAVWIMKDGSIEVTEEAKNMMKNLGGAKSTN